MKKRVLEGAGLVLVLVSFIALVFCSRIVNKRLFSEREATIGISTFHTVWSPVDRAYGKEWFGADSGYNYAYLRKFFETLYSVRVFDERLSKAALDGIDVLLLYVPNKPFSDQEIELILEYVGDGGGVFLIGDHTNVFGSSSNLNLVAECFGFKFRDDVLFDVEKDFQQYVKPGEFDSIFWRGIDYFKLRGPCSIEIKDNRSKAELIVGNCKTLRAIYSVNNFYPPPANDPKMGFGSFPFGVSAKYGKGKVFGFADSTVFSNFEIFYPGKQELLLNIVSWLLSERNFLTVILDYAPYLFLFFSVVVGVVWKVRAGIVGFQKLSVVLFCFLFLFHQSNLRPVEFLTPSTKTVEEVLRVHSSIDCNHLDVGGFNKDVDYAKRYTIFTQWVLRTDRLMFVTDSQRTGLLGAMFQQSDCIMRNLKFIDNIQQFQESDFDLKTLFLCDKEVGLDCVRKAVEPSGVRMKELVSCCQGLFLLSYPDGSEHLVLLNANRFSDAYMGGGEKVKPSFKQKLLYKKEYEILDILF